MTPERLESIKRRYAEKQEAKRGLTSTVVTGPLLGRLQVYAVIAAVSADDVPALIAEIEAHADWRKQRTALIEVHAWDECIFGGFYCMTCSNMDGDTTDLVPWPCSSLRAVGVTDADATEIIHARRAAIQAKAVRDAGA